MAIAPFILAMLLGFSIKNTSPARHCESSIRCPMLLRMFRQGHQELPIKPVLRTSSSYPSPIFATKPNPYKGIPRTSLLHPLFLRVKQPQNMLYMNAISQLRLVATMALWRGYDVKLFNRLLKQQITTGYTYL